MDWQICPRCKSSKYRNPSLVLYVNICGHVLCEACVDQLFVRGSGACPQCQKPLKRTHFRVQFFEDAEIDKEVDIRKKVSRELYLRQEDFPTLRDYNDYLEQVEDIIFNKVNGVDVEETKQIEDELKDKYKKELLKSKYKKSRDQEALDQIIQQERLANDESSKKVVDEKREEELRRAQEKEQLLDELQDSEMSAEAVLAVHRKKHGILDVDEHYPHVPDLRIKPVIEEPPPILTADDAQWFLKPDQSLHSIEEDLDGPPVPSPASLAQNGYLKAIRSTAPLETAMGFSSAFSARRALLAAFDGLYTFHK